MKNFMLSWGLIILSALFDSYAAFIVKKKFNELGPIDMSSLQGFFSYGSAFGKSPLLFTAALTFVTAPALWFLALNRVDLSMGYPFLVAFHLIFVLVFGLFFLGEALSGSKAIAMVLLLGSIYFLFKGDA